MEGSFWDNDREEQSAFLSGVLNLDQMLSGSLQVHLEALLKTSCPK